MFRGAILVDSVTLVVSDGHINISHFHLEPNRIDRGGSSFSLQHLLCLEIH